MKLPLPLGFLLICLGLSLGSAEAQTLDLGGTWGLSAVGQSDEIDAAVPGDAYAALLAAGRIPDPFYRDNEARVQWVAQTAWTFRRTFDVQPALLARGAVRLRCEGLDTVASVRLNGRQVGDADNQFRTWEFDVKKLLRPGENTLEITFGAIPAFLAHKQSEPSPLAVNSIPPPFTNGSAFVRKAPYSFGWDFGPDIRTVGIWRPISLVAFDDARLEGVVVRQTHGAPGEPVKLGVDVWTETTPGTGGTRGAEVVVRLGEHEVARGTGAVDTASRAAHVEVAVNDPQLWWPNGLGAHPLYTVETTLKDAAGHPLGHETQRIGLRTVTVFPKKDGEPFALAVNGVRFFVKGANFIPADTLPSRVTPEKLRGLVADAVAANMNTLRCWGGGYYEDDAFFDACDEAGLLVWGEFKFACAVYPAFDPAFVDNVRAEVRDQTLRLQHHASLGLWSGNNEVAGLIGTSTGLFGISPADYDRLFKQAIPEALHAIDPGAAYVSGSPGEGDDHYWAVWHGLSVFEDYNKQHGFISEFGMQSYPEPRTVDAYTSADDRKTVQSEVMRWHQRSAKGNDKIQTFIEHYFRPAKDFESTLWLSQIMQADGIRKGVEGWRRDWPHSTGSLFWQLNDEWPGPTWSSVDYFGRWKALQYAARRFYAPVLVSGVARADAGEVNVFVCNDQRAESGGTMRWCVTDLEGATLDHGEEPWRVAAQTSAKLRTLGLKGLVDAHGGPGQMLVWLEVADATGEVLSRGLVTFVPPKELALVPPQIAVGVAVEGDHFVVTLNSPQPALWTWLTLGDADFRSSDNFLHLQPGVARVVEVRPAHAMSLEAFKAALRVHSLTDTYEKPVEKPGVTAHEE